MCKGIYEEIMKVGPLLGRQAGVGATFSVAPTLVPAPFRPHGGRCAGAQVATTIYKDERLPQLVVSSGQRDGEPAGSGPKASQIFTIAEYKE